MPPSAVLARGRCWNYNMSWCGRPRPTRPPAMQHLLDFIQEHTLEEQLYVVAPCASVDLELFWRRSDSPDFWHVRPKPCVGPLELVHRRMLIEYLESRRANMDAFKQELHAMLAAQIAYADLILRDANDQLGNDLVQRYVRGQQAFIEQLQQAAQSLISNRPRMVVVNGGQAQTALRTGHLSVVR
jgi:hypothetical protein